MGFQGGFNKNYEELIKTILERAGIAFENGAFVALSAEDEQLLQNLKNYAII